MAGGATGTFDPFVFDWESEVFDSSAPAQVVVRPFGRGDLALVWNVYAADMAIDSNDLALDRGLATAVILSLFTDRRAEDADVLPDGQRDRRGWWGDAFPVVPNDRLGSRLWLLSREKQQSAVLARARDYVIEALQWLVDDKVADAIDVATEFTRPGLLGIAVSIQRPGTPQVEFRFDYAWQAIAEAA